MELLLNLYEVSHTNLQLLGVFISLILNELRKSICQLIQIYVAMNIKKLRRYNTHQSKAVT